MAEVQQFRLPDVGEGLTEAEIVSWKVRPGDTVKVNDVVVEIETAKSLVELPSPYAGTVAALLVEEGTTVPVGTPIIAVDVAADTGGGPAAGAGQAVAAGQPERQPVLVGYGPHAEAVRRRPRKLGSPAPPEGRQFVQAAFSTAAPVSVPVAPPEPARPVTPVPEGEPGALAHRLGEPAPPPPRRRGEGPVLAKPPVRKLARDLGVDLAEVTPTGPGGTVTRADVEAAAGTATSAAGAGAAVAALPRTIGGWEGLAREEREPIRSVRKATAAAVTRSAFTAPHVTEFLTVDATRTVRLVSRLRRSEEFAGVRLSPLALLARAVCLAVRRTPVVNAHWDEDAQQIVHRRYVNLGIAVATPRGLLVPNVKDADRLDLRGLATALAELTSTAREGRTRPADLSGGTISITNVGVFGVDTGTPILPPGEAAIVAFGAIRERPWVHRGTVRPRQVTTLALSFDHRLVDGEQGSRFLADVGALLEDPGRALAWA